MIRFLINTLLLIIILLSLSSYRYHTAVGFDHDYVQQNTILHTYYRINWSGHGSIWLGYGTVTRPANVKKPLEFLDPAAVFFQPVPQKIVAEKPQPAGGFRLIRSQKTREVCWLIIPAWLPILLSALLWWLIRHKYSRHHSPSNGSGDTTMPSSSE